MKLHNYHNDYVLQVEEAKMHQKHYRLDIKQTSTLPPRQLKCFFKSICHNFDLI